MWISGIDVWMSGIDMWTSGIDVLSVTKVLLEVKSHLLAERRTVALRVVLSAGEG